MGRHSRRIMSNMRLRVSYLARLETSRDEEAEGRHLVTVMKSALGRGGAPPVALMLRGDGVHLLPLGPIAKQGLPVQRFVAGLTRSTMDDQPLVEAVGIMGVVGVRQRHGGPRVPMAVVFLEWPDNRWWCYRALMEADTPTIRDESETVSSAVEGDSLPAGFGRWWSLARRAGLRVNLSRFPEENDLVH